MATAEEVKNYIERGLACEHIELIGDGQHFEVLIVSAEFRGKSRVQRRQRVYRALGGRMREEVHAPSMQTFAAEEWPGKNPQESPA
ncbi:MAG: BolA/IbaG family iron-sulfur metabolism protein [Pseudomonadota bacterium]